MGLAASRGDTGPSTTTTYEKMALEGQFRDRVVPKMPPAGRSVAVPPADCVQRDLQSEIYFPLPATPTGERRFRRLSHGPGEIYVHHGLKDQRLPGEDFRYGLRGAKGDSVRDAMESGQLLGVAEYRSSCSERVYSSVKREPLGKPYVRGHALKTSPEGFGLPSGSPIDAKELIFPRELPQETEEARQLYRRTHKSYLPGERIERSYSLPAVTQEEGFRWGAKLTAAVEGAGARLALNTEVDDDGLRRTRLVQKGCEDYRRVQHPRPLRRGHAKQGAEGPPLPPGHRYGAKSSVGEYTLQSCVRGYYRLEEQLPDQDLGRCVKPGRRNVTKETRAFGVPSVRTDLAAPLASRRSLGDCTGYGDEGGAAAMMNPQRFDLLGIPDREFLVRRSKAELEALIKARPLDNVDFEALWEEALLLFDDDRPVVSLDAILHVQTQKVKEQVARDHQSLHLAARAV